MVSWCIKGDTKHKEAKETTRWENVLIILSTAKFYCVLVHVIARPFLCQLLPLGLHQGTGVRKSKVSIEKGSTHLVFLVRLDTQFARNVNSVSPPSIEILKSFVITSVVLY